MLTIFTSPKAFRGHIADTQKNAIESWTRLHDDVEILLVGDDPGTAEASQEFGVSHIGQIARNEFGTPLLSDIFAKAQSRARNKTVCFINTDIILLNDFCDAIKRIKRQKFLLVGYRHDLNVTGRLDFNDSNWQENLRNAVRRNGVLHEHTGIDFFVFPRGLFGEIPPFAVGRPAYDNWLLYKARAMPAPVIDLTPVVTIVHQNHDYSHIPKQTTPGKSPETIRNLELAGGVSHIFTLYDVSHELTEGGIRRPKRTKERSDRFKEVMPVLHPHLWFLFRLLSLLTSPRSLATRIFRKTRRLLKSEA